MILRGLCCTSLMSFLDSSGGIRFPLQIIQNRLRPSLCLGSIQFPLGNLQKHNGNKGFRDSRRPHCPAGRPSQPAPVDPDGDPRDGRVRPLAGRPIEWIPLNDGGRTARRTRNSFEIVKRMHSFKRIVRSTNSFKGKIKRNEYSFKRIHGNPGKS